MMVTMKVSTMIMSMVMQLMVMMTVIIIVIAMRSIAVIVEKDSAMFHMRISTMNYQYYAVIYTHNRELKKIIFQ